MRKKITDKIRDSVKKAYEAIADEFNETRQTQWPEFQHFLKYVKKRSVVLDLGCGNGRLYRLLIEKGVDYTGIDNNALLLEKAGKNFPEAKFKYGDMVDLDFPDKSFDIIFSIASFHHIPGKKLRCTVISEINRLLKQDGILIMTVWNLFQWKYIKPIISSIFSLIIHFGLKYSWNDLWIKWGDSPIKRYYHAFLPSELIRYFQQNDWKIEEFYFVKKGTRVKFWQCFNICLIARKVKS